MDASKLLNSSLNALFQLERDELIVRTKSVNEVIRKYNDSLLRIAYDLLNGRTTEAEFAEDHKDLLEDLSVDAYQEGMREGGIDDPDEEWGEDDRDLVVAWTDEQSSFVEDFADWLNISENTEGTRSQVKTRIEFWVNALMVLGALGRASAQGDPVCEWEYDPDKEHCETCLKLDGSSHRLSWYVDRNYLPQMPGASMECGGYYCGCKLRNKKTGVTVLPGG